jgi:Mg2+-importing ATPase
MHFCLTFGVLLLVFHAGETFFRTGWFVESLVTQILMIFAVRTRRHLFASKPHPSVTALAFGMAALTLALPFLPVGAWFEFVALPVPYFAFLLLVVAGFLVLIEVVKRFFSLGCSADRQLRGSKITSARHQMRSQSFIAG